MSFEYHEAPAKEPVSKGEVVDLRPPSVRHSNEIYDDEKVVILYGSELTQLKRKVPYKLLLSATQALEQELIEQKRREGVAFHGCGFNEDKTDPIVRTGSFEHVLEHALLAITDSQAPLDEQGIGLTIPLSHYKLVTRKAPVNELEVRLLPPPSVTVPQLRSRIEQSLRLLQKTNGKVLNLRKIASSL